MSAVLSAGLRGEIGANSFLILRTDTVTLHAENAEQVDARWRVQMQQASEELRVLLDGYDVEEADVSPLADRP